MELANSCQPLISFDLEVNSSLEATATILTELDVLGVKLQVFEVKKPEFFIYFKKYVLQRQKSFDQMCKQQLTAAKSAGHWADFSKDG